MTTSSSPVPTMAAGSRNAIAGGASSSSKIEHQVQTLNLEQAARLLNMHPVTVGERARAGIIPAAKPGKRWVFVEADLVAYLRRLYPCNRQALQGDGKDERLCHSTSARAHRTGGFASPTTDAEYKKALGLPTA